MSAISQLEAEASRILERLRRLEEISVPSAAKLLGKSPEWVRRNLPVIIHGPKSHHVRAADIEAYQLRRTLWPKGEFPSLLQSAEDERRRELNKQAGRAA